jgi:hypothetical protein
MYKFTFEWAKKISSGRWHSEDVVPGKENTAYSQKLKKFL